jgi:hypothetical protein
MAKFIDINGQLSEVELGGVKLYKEALTKGVSVRELVNDKYPTRAEDPDAFKQMCGFANMRFERDPVTGRPAATVDQMLNPEASSGSQVTQPASPDSRILFPAAVLALMEDKLQGAQGQVSGTLDSIVGYNQTIATRKFEQPVLSYTGANGPEDSQWHPVSQNAASPLMVSLKSADVSRSVQTKSISMEISQEALQSTPMDFISMSLARFYTIAGYNAWIDNLSYLLSGDPDATVTSFSAGTSALSTFTAQSLDSTITAAGTLTHKAYRAYLLKNPLYMQPSHVICSVNSAMQIEDRSGRPTNVQNNSTDRLDTPMELIWPSLGNTLKVIALPDGTFPANTFMGLQQNAPAIGKVTSLFCEYEAAADIIERRSRVLRIDKGDLYWRVWDDAFSVMTTTVA